MFDLVQEFIEASKSAADHASLESAFGSAISQFGFDGFGAWTLSDLETPPADAVWISRYAPEWCAYYVSETLFNVDPAIHLSATRNVPFLWSEVMRMNDLTDAQRGFMLEASDSGMGFGMTVPIHMHASAPGTVGVSGAREEIRPEVMHSVHLMSVYLYDASRRISLATSGYSDQSPQLTAREAECLKWAVMGKTDWEIGEILCISQATAHFHIEKAKRKFGVPTRTQAVVQAVMTGQIIP